MIDIKFLICTECLKCKQCKLRRFDNLRSLKIHMTLKHGKRIDFAIKKGVVRIVRRSPQKRRTKPRRIKRQSA